MIENLKYTTLPIQSNDLCSEIYILQWNPNTMICAGNGEYQSIKFGNETSSSSSTNSNDEFQEQMMHAIKVTLVDQ